MEDTYRPQILDGIDRFEVIDDSGRAYTARNLANVEYSVQDGGTTLKIFLRKDRERERLSR